jgi:hypothetical protein
MVILKSYKDNSLTHDRLKICENDAKKKVDEIA